MKIKVGDTIKYNDGRPGHTEARAQVIRVTDLGMEVQFEDRADTNSIRFDDRAWMDHVTVESVSNHTPGPWSSLQFGGDIPQIGITPAVGSPGDSRKMKYWLAWVPLACPLGSATPGQPIPEVDVREASANARLIAAAPELLAACIHALAKLECAAEKAEPGSQMAHWFAGEDYGLKSTIRAAIAKATGGAQ